MKRQGNQAVLTTQTTMLHPQAINLNIRFGYVLVGDHTVNTIYHEDQSKRLVIPRKDSDTLAKTILVNFLQCQNFQINLKIDNKYGSTSAE